MELTERYVRCVLEADVGVYPQIVIAEKVGISQPRVHQILKDARREVDKLERDLLVARAGGKGWLIFVPNSVERTLGLAYVQWLVDQLRERGKRVTVEHIATANGSGFLLWDKTDYDSEGANS